MEWWPFKSETVVLPYSANEFVQKLKRCVRKDEDLTDEPNSEEYLFNGRVREDSFRISEVIDYPQNYLPLIRGYVENTSKGCIVFLKYQLFVMTLIYLIFWSTLCIAFTFYFAVLQKAYLYALLSFGFGAVQYMVVITNFHKQVKKSKKQLQRFLAI